MYLEKIFEKSVDLITPVLSSSSSLHTKKWQKIFTVPLTPQKCPPLLQSLHQINLTILFHFLSLDSIDYIMIILELISPQQRTIEQKYLLTTQKITIIKKKKTEYCHRPPARPRSITEAAEKANFWSTDPTKNIKRIQKFDPPHLY